MKNLKSFCEYLRKNRLNDITIDTVNMLKEMDIPFVKALPLTSDKQVVDLLIGDGEKFLASIEKQATLDIVKENLRRWESKKLPGISIHDIHPSDLVLIYALQKKVIWKFLPDFTNSAKEAIAITLELEDYYTKVQKLSGQMLYKIQKNTEVLLKEGEEKLLRIENKYHFLVNEVKDYAIISLDSNGIITTWNKGASKIKGYKKEEIIGQHFSIFYTEDDKADNFPKITLDTAARDGRFAYSGWRVRKDKSLFWADVVITALKNTKGIIKGYVKITRDLTEKRKAEAELQLKSEELKRSNAELEQFAYVASHDLQEPLRMVSSYVQLLAKRYNDKLDKDANDFIGFAVDGTNRMRNLINGLLEYSRVNRIKPFEWINLNELLDQISKDLDVDIKKNSVEILFKNLPPIYGDTVLIWQLFQHLITNAIKFRSEKKPIIIIEGKKTNGEYLFSIKDNGIGIQKEYRDKIFVIFQRLHAKDKYPGTGMGLAICKKIVERHGGQIWVESETGEGSTFYFTINDLLKGKREKPNS